MTADRGTWVIVGAQGMLGTELQELLASRGIAVIGLDRSDVDITDPASVAALGLDADVVVNCAAYTAVDAAEDDEATADAVNGRGAGNLAKAAADSGARFVHISTDYVFAGDATSPYAEDAPIEPRSAYGRTKATGEQLVRESGADALIVRTAWLYGQHGNCFPKTIAKLAADRPQSAVVDDQRGQPTWTRDLAEFIIALIDADAPAGTYHGTATGEATWYDFARAIVASAKAPAQVDPTTTDAFPRPAPRPAYSVLGHEASTAAGVAPIGDWRERWDAAADAVLS